MLGVPIMLKLVADVVGSLEDMRGRMRVGGPSSVTWLVMMMVVMMMVMVMVKMTMVTMTGFPQ